MRTLLAREGPWLTPDEKCVTSEHGAVVSILHEEANAVLGVARCVNTLHLDVANSEALIMGGCLGNAFTVLAANDVKLGITQLGKLIGSISIVFSQAQNVIL